MKVVLANARQQVMEREWLPPLSLGYLASFLESQGHEVVIVDSEVNRFDTAQACNIILAHKPDVVGITATTTNRFETIALCDAIRGNSKALLVAGGPHFTATAKDALKNIRSIDVVVRREGEITFAEVLAAYGQKKGFAGIAGVSFRDESGAIVENADRPFIQDLDALPRPAYHLFPLAAYNARLEGEYASGNSIGVVSSRGCPFNCEFCANNTLWQGSLRMRSPKNFVDEIEFLYDTCGYRSFDIWDDTMTVKKSHATGICEEILRRKLKIRWYARSRVDTVNREMLGLFKEAGCVSLGFGVESGSPRILESIRKGISVDAIKSAIKASAELGFYTKAFFILSLPGEEQADIRASITLMKELNGYGKKVMAGAGIAKIYPGTRMETQARANGILPSDFSWNTPCEFPENALFNDSVFVPFYAQPQLPLEGLYRQISALQRRTVSGIARSLVRSLASVRNVADVKMKIKKFILTYVK